MLKKISVILLSLMMLIQSTSALMLGARSVALLLGTLSATKAYSYELIPSDRTSWFNNSSSQTVQGLFDSEQVSAEKQKQASTDHKDKAGLENKSGQVVKEMTQDNQDAFNFVKQAYVATQNISNESPEYQGLLSANYESEPNIYTGGEGLCQDVNTTSALNITETTKEIRSCSATLSPDIKFQECTLERNFKASRAILESATGNTILSGSLLTLQDGFVNANSVELANNEGDIERKSGVVTASLTVENASMLEYAKLTSVQAQGMTIIKVNGSPIYQEGNSDFECSVIGDGCTANSEPQNWSGEIDFKELLRNGLNTIQLDVETVNNSQTIKALFSIDAETKLQEFRSDYPTGCSTQSGSGTVMLDGFQVPLLNLDKNNELLPTGRLPEFVCQSASNSTNANGSNLTVSKDNFAGLVTGLFNGDSTDTICYQASAGQAAYVGDIKVCDTMEGCPAELQGKTFSDLAAESNHNETCQEIEADNTCQLESKTCIDEVGGVCQEWEKNYSCEVQNTYGTVEQVTTEDCGIPICDHDGNCTNSKSESVANFARVASQLSVMQMAANDMKKDLDGVAIKVFKGESRSCRSMQLWGLGNNCCKGVSGVSATGLVFTLYQVSKNQWVRGQLASGIKAIGADGVTNSITQGYQAIKDGVAGAWDAVKAPFQEAYHSVFEGTTSAATNAAGNAAGSAASGAGSAVAEGGISAGLSSMYQSVLGSAREFLIQDLGISESIADSFISATPVGEGTSYALGSVFQTISTVYMIYSLAKLVISLITACKKSEYQTQFKAKTKSCIYKGQKCTKKSFFGGCVQKKKYYCCFNSPLARIIAQQGGRQIGKPNHCGGFSPQELERMDFDKINLGEWTRYLQQSNVLPSAQEAKKRFDDKFMQSNIASSTGHSEYSLSSERIRNAIAETDTESTRKEVQDDVVVNRSALSADGSTIGNASTIYDELPEQKEWTDVLIDEANSSDKGAPKIYTFRFPETAGYRLVYKTVKPANYPAESSGGWFSDEDGNLLSWGGNSTTHYGNCVTQTRDIIRKKNSGEVFSLGGYAEERIYEDEFDYSNTTRTKACSYDVKIYKRVLK